VYFRTSLKDASAISRHLGTLGLQDYKGISFMHDYDQVVCVSYSQENTRQLENLRRLNVRRNELIDDELHDLYWLHSDTEKGLGLPKEQQASRPLDFFDIHLLEGEETQKAQNLDDFIIQKEQGQESN
jgi:hypothetical protein